MGAFPCKHLRVHHTVSLDSIDEGVNSFSFLLEKNTRPGLLIHVCHCLLVALGYRTNLMLRMVLKVSKEGSRPPLVLEVLFFEPKWENQGKQL